MRDRFSPDWHGGTQQGRGTRDRIVAFLAAYTEEHGYSPTRAEIADGVGIATSTLGRHLKILEYEGRVSRGPGPRTWRAL